MEILNSIKSYFGKSVTIHPAVPEIANHSDTKYFKRSEGDWNEEQLQMNSAVAICTDLSLNMFRKPALRLYKPEGEGRRQVTRHPMANLIYRPNRLYPSKLLWNAVYIDYWYVGNAFLRIDREGTLTPKALYHLPAEKVSIVSKNQWIDHYEYRTPKGTLEKIPASDVIHFRHGINKTNNRFGWAPLQSTLLQVMTDQEAARFLSALLKNNAVPGIVVIPGKDVTVDSKNRGIIKRLFQAAFSGANRGGVMVASNEAKIEVVGQSPKDLEMGTIKKTPEERICGAFLLPPEITPFGAGSVKSTFNNKAEAHQMAYTNNIIPTCEDFADTLNYRLGEEFGVPDGEYFYGYDYSMIEVLQEDIKVKGEYLAAMVAGGIYAVNEARKELKLPSTSRPEDDLPIVIGNSNPIDDAVKRQLEAKDKGNKKMLELTEGSVDGEIVE